MKEKVKKESEPSSGIRAIAKGVLAELSLERIFIIFGLLYIPVAALYLRQGVAAYVILMLYTLILGLIALLMLAKFVMILSAHANARSGMYGSIVSAYFLNVFTALVGLKILAHVVWQIMPPNHTGIVCDIVFFVKGLFAVLHVQTALDSAILTSLPVILLVGLWSVRKS